MNDHPKSIEVRQLTKLYGRVKAIQNLTFDVHSGDIVGFLGPNGAGKSTTMRILSGLMSATSGAAWVGGVSVASDPLGVKRKIGYMPENNPLPDDMRVVEYLRHRARLKEVPMRERKKRIDEVLELCDLGRTAETKMIGALSKGYRQRVGIADCLLGKPEVVIMDEPTIGLDPHQILSIRKLLRVLRGQMTIILSSHILPEIEAVCDRSIIINKGQIVAEGKRDALRREFVPGINFEICAKASVDALKTTLLTISPEGEFINESEADGYTSLTYHTLDENLHGERVLQAIGTKYGMDAVREIRRVEPTLEEIFIAATRPTWNMKTTLPARRKDT